MEKENENTKQELGTVRNALGILEKDYKRNNVIVKGLNIQGEDPNELKNTMVNFMKEHLQVTVEVNKVIKIGNKTCLVQTKDAAEKDRLMENKHKLANLKTEKVFISDDYTTEEMNIHKQKRNMAEKFRREGKQVKVGMRKIVVEGKEWRWNKAKNQLEAKN